VTYVAIGLKTALEERDPADYYTECCEYLMDFVTERPKLIGSQVHTALTELLRALRTPPEKRRFENPT